MTKRYAHDAALIQRQTLAATGSVGFGMRASRTSCTFSVNFRHLQTATRNDVTPPRKTST
jgi:hypothetical protein